MKFRRAPRLLPVLGLTALMILAVSPVDAGKDKKRDKKRSKVEFSGFLGDYDQLQTAGKGVDFLWGYTKRLGILRDYDRAIVDPVLVSFDTDTRGAAVDPEKLAELTTFFRQRLIEELSAERTIEVVDEPGPGVMRLRVAITDIEVAKKGANIGTKAAGMALGVGLFVPSVDVGGATMECEVLDSVSGERLVAVVDRESGRRMMNVASMKSMGDAKNAMKAWAKEFRKNVRRVHQGELPPGVRAPDDR